MKTIKAHLPEIIFISFIIFTFFLVRYLLSPPEYLPSDAPENQFSAERAFSHNMQISKAPHSLGTAENLRVKEYIKSELIRLGLEYGEQSATAIYDSIGIRAGYVTNVFGILKGNGSGGKVVLFVGHYDTKPHSLGAADDGSAVVAMLEAARALKKHEALDNDVIFLFTDGEESGLFGAKSFTEGSPLMEKIGLVINIESRGSSGPTLAYEFNEDNGWVIKELNRAVPRLFSGSIFYEIYKRMPNDTDFTLFRQAGLSGVNMAFIDDYVNYHVMTDSPENLDLNSLQHHGDFIMASALHFGNIHLGETKADDAIFFNWMGASLVVYSSVFNLALIFFSIILAVVFFYLGFKNQEIRLGRLLFGFLFYILSLVVILLISWIILNVITKGYPHYSLFHDLNFFNVKYYFFAFSSLSLALFSFVNILLKKIFNVLEILSGVIIFSLLLMLLMHFMIPTGSYLFIVPSIFLLLGGILTVLRRLSFDNRKAFYFVVQFIVLVPVIGLYFPYIHLFYIALSLKMIFGGLFMLLLLWGYLIIPISLLQRKRVWILPLLALIVAITGFVFAHIYSKPSSDRPIQTSINYYLDADNSKAYWVSENLEADVWNNQFFQDGVTEPLIEIYPSAERSRLKAEAPIVSLPSPEAIISSDTILENRRHIDLIISTQRDAAFCEIYFHRNSNLIFTAVNGLPVNPDAYINWPGEYCELSYHNIRGRPLNLTLIYDVNKPLELFITERSLGIPEIKGFNPMPKSIIPSTGYNSYQTIVKKTWRF